MLFDIIIGVLFLAGVCIYEFPKSKSYSLFFIIAVLTAGWFLFPPFTAWVLAIGWKSLLLHWLPLYIGIGVAVATLKWILRNLKVAEKIRDLKETFNANLPITLTEARKAAYSQNIEKGKSVYPRSRDGYDPDMKEPVAATAEEEAAYRRFKFMELWNRSSYRENINLDTVKWENPDIITELLVPRAKKHIDDISIWVVEWPFVVVGMVISDFLMKIGKHLAKLLDRVFTGLSKVLIRNAAKGI